MVGSSIPYCAVYPSITSIFGFHHDALPKHILRGLLLRILISTSSHDVLPNHILSTLLIHSPYTSPYTSLYTSSLPLSHSPLPSIPSTSALPCPKPALSLLFTIALNLSFTLLPILPFLSSSSRLLISSLISSASSRSLGPSVWFATRESHLAACGKSAASRAAPCPDGSAGPGPVCIGPPQTMDWML